MLRAPNVNALPGRLAENVMHFGRVLRTAGMPVPTDRIQLALNALQVGGLESRTDFHATLQACLLDRIEHRELFDQAFTLFWRDPDITGRMMAMLLPRVQTKTEQPSVPENRRLGEALFPHQPNQPNPPPPPEKIEVDATLTWNERELLQKADFETMTADEWRAAQRLLRQLAPLFEPLTTRRTERASGPGAGARVDGRATLQALARTGGDLMQLRWRRPRVQPAPLVVLADISGSMSRYSRMLLHFTHTLGHADARVESFVFGTRLTRTTRALRQRDPDLAVSRVVQAVQDWSGGTRISACLHQFNQQWARRVLSGRATVLLISDGLEHGTPDDPRCETLRFEMERLHKSCRRLIWLNPLLRFEQFQPRAAGIRAMLPSVDEFLPAHNLQSLAELAQVLAGAGRPKRLQPRA
ncbi:vWA domain-containing protein [Rubrivivax rivuli]|uniref:VWA domain-containing protein n=1 Tax=Rubrivivax rivuli TaxID=1862385 RepID=A0A437RCL5_9BURK|nr:VWA domain-containing protein [Rubrivivax rivuli]RVU44407.1 VWA domain-containing protein [Rubrivivax rivuli]